VELSRYSDGLRAELPGFYSRQGQETFFYSMASRPALEPTQPPIQWVPGALSLIPVREPDHSPPSSVEVKSGGAIIQLPNTYLLLGA
jgi:hypothetical protein